MGTHRKHIQCKPLLEEGFPLGKRNCKPSSVITKKGRAPFYNGCGRKNNRFILARDVGLQEEALRAEQSGFTFAQRLTRLWGFSSLTKTPLI